MFCFVVFCFVLFFLGGAVFLFGWNLVRVQSIEKAWQPASRSSDQCRNTCEDGPSPRDRAGRGAGEAPSRRAAGQSTGRPLTRHGHQTHTEQRSWTKEKQKKKKTEAEAEKPITRCRLVLLVLPSLVVACLYVCRCCWRARLRGSFRLPFPFPFSWSFRSTFSLPLSAGAIKTAVVAPPAVFGCFCVPKIYQSLRHCPPCRSVVSLHQLPFSCSSSPLFPSSPPPFSFPLCPRTHKTHKKLFRSLIADSGEEKGAAFSARPGLSTAVLAVTHSSSWLRSFFLPTSSSSAKGPCHLHQKLRHIIHAPLLALARSSKTQSHADATLGTYL
jgi:hypothetical protein